MYKNVLSIIIIMISMTPIVAIAGRHGIAREEASRIVNDRFAQFYRDEANRKQAEQRDMEQEILKAKDIEAAMLRELQNMDNQNKIKSADELEQSMQRELADLNHDAPDHTDHTNTAGANYMGHNGAADINPNRASAPSGDHTFFDLKSGSKENNPFLFLQDLHHAEPTKRAAGIKEVVDSLQSLPNTQKLSEEFTRDLAKISPEMAREFSAAYKASLTSTKSSQNTTNKDLSKSTKLDRSSNGSSNKGNDSKAKQGAVAVTNDQAIKNNTQEYFKLQDLNKSQTFNAVTNYSFSPNKLYQIYTSPHKVTVIVLDSGEKIVGNPICGDPVRWKISTMSNATGQHLTIQPLRSGITTSITVATNQGRLYLLEATSLTNNYMAVVRWNYAS